jgi:hypothetical protein
MTHPIRNRQPQRNRTRLLVGCGSAALAMALALAPNKAQAQAFGGSGNVVFGSAEINNVDVTTDRVDVFTPTVVIDWTPNEDAGGNALDFLPTGTTGIFQSSDFQNFAVLNRILPSTNGNVTVMDGTVISQFLDPQTGATSRAGFVAFYSPTGLLIGNNAVFDVGSLMLSTLDISPTDFQNFAEFGGNMTMTGAPGSTARVQINPGAQISATAENSFFAVVAADVQMLGTARINGSHAYVAGEVVNLSFSNGLFNISVPVGTAAGGTVMELNGDIGGPSSNGIGDNHMIYGVAAAQADPISMLFGGNLGFDPAQSAGVVNGEIILSANYSVFGRFVNGGLVSDGINANFAGNSEITDTAGEIFISDIAASSSLLAISNFNVTATADLAGSTVNGNLMLVGGNSATMAASNGQTFGVTGDLLVSAQDYGVLSSSLQNLDLINAQGGVASVTAFLGSTIQVGGNALVAADAFGGADDLSGIAGSALGGQATLSAIGGSVLINGSTTVSAGAYGPGFSSIFVGADARGGSAEVNVDSDGTLGIGQDLTVRADALAAQGSLFGPSTASNAFGGQSRISIFNNGGGGAVSIGGSAFVSANATGGTSNNAGAGSIGDAGEAIVDIQGPGQIIIAGTLDLQAVGGGGDNAGGIGGIGYGGRASATTFGGGTINIGGTIDASFDARADGFGGSGQTGGDGFGGIAGANAIIGTITIAGRAFSASNGTGGSAFYGFGGNGGIGRGGNAYFQADGTLTQTASVIIGGDATASAEGIGGNGGPADGSAIPAGRGGDGYGGQFTVPNQADPAFGSGAFILAGGDNGTISVTGDAFALASGYGGGGGSGTDIVIGGPGGNAFGGLAQIGLALLGQNGSLGQGSASFGLVTAEANAFGGNGGFSIGDFPSGDGGDAVGGTAVLTVRAGTVTATDITLNALGYGGDGANGGVGTGGAAAAIGSLGGSLTTGTFAARADGYGGFGGFDSFSPGISGDGFGGEAELDFQGITVQISGDATVQAIGVGGATGSFTAGNGTGGTARLGVLGTIAGSGTVGGNTIVSANGFGGGANNGIGSFAGNGIGGTASVQAQGGGTVSLATLQVQANGFGGEGEIAGYESGDGTGGVSDITATGAGSQITIASNTTNLQSTNENFGAILSAVGVGGLGAGGTGIGGTGRGGTITLAASQGGAIALPADPLNDPDSIGFIRLFARGFGGDTIVNGGTGGNSFGGSANIEVIGGSLTMGETVLSSFTQGGTAGTGVLDVTGGNAFGGSRRVIVRDGGTATLHLVGGAAGAQGGNGTGTGNGGNAYIGQNLFEIDNATATIIGNAAVFDQSLGGDGRQGGSVFNVNPLTGLTGSLDIVLDFATINFIPDALGIAGIGGDFVTRGGNGVVRGGDAQGPNFNVTINQTNLSGGSLVINPVIQGGDASDPAGIGGDALGSLINIAITGSQLTLPGQTSFASDAQGGTGGANGTGGSATAGAVDVSFTGSTINLVADQQGGPGNLFVRSEANAGAGGTMGNATSNRAIVNLIDSTLAGATIAIEARASAAPINSGQLGGNATGGEARLSLSGVSGVTADLLEISGSAQTGQGGSATGGIAVLDVAPGGTATITAPQVNILADAFTQADDQAGIAGTTQGGQARLGSNGGSLSVSGDVAISAAGSGAVVANLLSGATARGGQAQLFATQGGSVTLGGNVTLDASATGSNGSLVNPSSVSDAFGGSAIINIFGTGGGTISIGGDAFAVASAQGGRSNNAGPGSIGDAGIAIANIDTSGLITVTGLLRLEAVGVGGENAGGVGGTGLGGRASAATFAGGTIDIGTDFDADSRGEGGDGQTGGDGFGGIAGAAAIVGTITISGSAFAGSEGTGGSAIYGFGGNGGLGRGGNSYFQANGTLAQSATLSIAGDAIAFAQGVGGDGGATDGNQVAAGRGGDGIGGQFTVVNQADSGFTSGAFILAGGDNGNISVGGDAVAVASGFAGNGGIGGSILPGGAGGNAFGGLAQIGLALLGQNGSLGLGTAVFANAFAEANAFGGQGGLSLANTPTGDGGNGTAGGAFVTVRAGDITAGQIGLNASGYGGEGAIGGIGTGGEAGIFGSLGGTLTATGLSVVAQGFGGFTSLGTGGDAFGGLAVIEGDGISVTIDGNALLSASASGGASGDGAGGNGTGGEAYIATVTSTTPGTIIVTGHAAVVANGVGGDTATSFAAGNGTGGNAFIEALGGSTITLGSAQAIAIGRGGSAQTHEGGNGTGGTARLGASGAGSQLTIQRNVPLSFAEGPAGGAMLIADGIGAATRGGDGIGGTGRGGTIEITAAQGGSIALPQNIAADPNSALPELNLFARGIGGGSDQDDGIAGEASGGTGTIQADGSGSNIVMGRTVFSVFAQGGSSLDTSRNIGGGQAFGGSRQVRVLNGASATLALVGGTSGAAGGNGSGLGDGGDAFGGRNQVELVNGTLNVVGVLDLSDGSTGGNGNTGGDVFGNGEAGVISFSASGSTINFTPDASGQSGIAIGGTSQGGQGVIAGGNAQAPTVFFDLIGTDMTGGSLVINPIAQGGNASALGGTGGNAFGSRVTVNVADSTLGLLGEVLISGDARGGAGGTDVTGGSATSGDVEANFSNSSVTITADGNGNPGILRLRSQADGGEGATMGLASSGRATLNIADTTLTAAQIAVEARGFANAISAGQTGGTAIGGTALLGVSGDSGITADLIEINSTAQTSSGGNTLGGESSLVVAAGSAATIDAGQINLLADALGGDRIAAANRAGQFAISIGGGDVNAGSLLASATGDLVNSDLDISSIVADGGSLNVTGDLIARALDDILIRTGAGGIIGGPRVTGSTTNVSIRSDGLITIQGDNNGAAGLGGNLIDLTARDIEIAAGARIAADRVSIFSLDRDHTAILGGDTQGSGFTLTGDEVARISARQFDFLIPGLRTPSDPNQPDLLIRDLALSGSGADGFTQVRIFTGDDGPAGIIRVEGTVSYSAAGVDDRLEFNSDRLEVVTPGGIRMEESDGVLGGNLAINARDVWVADADTIAQLQANRSFAGRDELLAAAATGSDDPLGYLRARGVTIAVGNSLLVRNTGEPLAGGGILVGDGGLSISANGQQSASSSPLDVFAYGARRTATGTLVVGADFFGEVNFNRVSPGSTLYLDAAAFNDCIINTGVCPEPPPPPDPPVEPPVQINNPTVLEGPLTTGEEPPVASDEEEERFGMDFPEQPDAPLISEDPLLDDPVTSGGDASLYSGGGQPRGEDE